MPRALLPIALAVAASIAPAAASEPDQAPERSPVRVAIGVKAGFIPPLLAAPEIVVHAPHFFGGVFGIVTGGGLGAGGRRTTLGGEVGYEFGGPDTSTPYLSLSLFRYEAATDAAGFYERSSVLTLAGGYEWKWNHFELQLGGGALFLLSEDLPPPASCTGFCLDFTGIVPKVLPTLDLAGRYRF